MKTIHVTHARMTLALHELQPGEGRPLLHLHGLGLSSPEIAPDDLTSWPGPIHALDFTGHGASMVPTGGGYTPEVLIGDVDAAIQHLGGEVTLVGRGLGAYVALLVAGARPDAVRGAILCDGPGIAGGGPAPGTPQAIRVDPDASTPPDPWAVAELSKDVRPPDYAVDFARLASANAHPPLAIVAKARPEWLVAVAEEVGAAPSSIEDALRSFSKR
jgi:pimeloyl-ACP methyl ester carboxylesterase